MSNLSIDNILGSLPGAVLGSLILGLAEMLTAGFVSSQTWLSNGAQPSDTVRMLLRKSGIIG